MSNTVLYYLRSRRRGSDWTQSELAEFYRVEGALVQSGLSVATDRGVTDEGEPWFIFCRQDSDEVIAHIARIDSEYVVVASGFPGVARGRDFRSLIRRLLDSYPVTLPRAPREAQKLFIHPAAMLVALVAVSFVQSSTHDAPFLDGSSESPDKGSSFLLRHELAMLWAVAIAAILVQQEAESIFQLFQDTLLKDVGPTDGPEKPLISAVQVTGPLDWILDNFSADPALSAKSDKFQSLDPGTREDVDNSGAGANSAAANDAGASINNTSGSLASKHKIADVNFTSLGSVATNPTHDGAASFGTEWTWDLGRIGGGMPAHWNANSPVIFSNATGAIKASGLTEIGLSSSNKDNINFQHLKADLTSQTDAFRVVANGISANPEQTFLLTADNNIFSDTIQLALHALAPSFTSDVVIPKYQLDMTGSNTTQSAGQANNAQQADDSQVNLSHHFDNAAFDLLTLFVDNTAHFDVVISGQNVILVDSNVSHLTGGQAALLTWDMDDGSTLSIVGIIPYVTAAIA